MDREELEIALDFALAYIAFIKMNDFQLHKMADGLPSIEKTIVAARENITIKY